MTIQSEKVTGLWGDRSVAITDDAGLLLWSNDLGDLEAAIQEINRCGDVFVGETALTRLLKRSPDEIAMMLLPDTTIRLLANRLPTDQIQDLRETGRNKTADEVERCLERGGFAVRDQLASRATSWFATPNTDKGGH